MRNTFKGKDYLAFKDMTREEIEFIVDLSLSFKQKWLAREPHRYFAVSYTHLDVYKRQFRYGAIFLGFRIFKKG